MARKINCWESLDGVKYENEDLADDRDARVFQEFLGAANLTNFVEVQDDSSEDEYFTTEQGIAITALKNLFQYLLATGDLTVHTNGTVTLDDR
jgi:hypothetical protein